LKFFILLLGFTSLACYSVLAQSTNASITGVVYDATKSAIEGAQVTVLNVQTGVRTEGKTNVSGAYVVIELIPGTCRVEVEKQGFKAIVQDGLTLHVQDNLQLNFHMAVGSVSESVTVTGGVVGVDTTDATVSTVIDRQLIANMPMNGRSFQSLINLTPGVALTGTSITNPGQFSVNGQRSDSNYFTVDGVSANAGVVTSLQGVGSAGGAATSASGGYNNLASLDALEEFKIQTSTFAPEFGRSPGAQVSLLTRRGTNRISGTLFDYLRNDALDANNWFTNQNRLAKPALRQNDFGGVVGAPIVPDKLFYFFSYEGLRLRQPVTVSSYVPSLAVRQSAPASIQPFLNAFPQPTSPACVAGTKGCDPTLGPFNATYSNPTSLDATSIRMDYNLNNRIKLFGRYNHAPSAADIRSGSALTDSPVGLNTITAGSTLIVSPVMTNDLRFNFTRSSIATNTSLDSFGSATPFSDSVFTSGFTRTNAYMNVVMQNTPGVKFGQNGANRNRDMNIVDGFSFVHGAHQFKFGVDYLRIVAEHGPQALNVTASLTTTSKWSTGVADTVSVQANKQESYLFHDISMYAQDTWKIGQKLTVTYGLRWDIDPAVTSPDGTYAWGIDQSTNIPTTQLLPLGHSLYPTSYSRLAPRIGIAFQARQDPRFGTVLRTGFGVFYDTADDVGALTNGPYVNSNSFNNVVFPLTSAQLTPPAVPASAPYGTIWTIDPGFKQPYVLQFDGAVEQSLGDKQTLSLTYVGAAGRRLPQLFESYGTLPTFFKPNTLFGIFRNLAYSNYDALQVQFRRQLSHGLQVLSSYSYDHSLDNGSSRNPYPPLPGYENSYYGSSDFDIRHTFTAAASYNIPSPRGNALVKQVLGQWGIDPIYRFNTAPPVDLIGSTFSLNGAGFAARPNVNTSLSLLLSDPDAPGGKRFNPAAFSAAPTGVQGSLGRNVMRGFHEQQMDISVRREFSIKERLKLQFRADIFNITNHPNFAAPVGTLTNQSFGLSTGLLGAALGATNATTGITPGFSPLYQLGGPRSMQLALKLLF
jgi:hypothetical protein